MLYLALEGMKERDKEREKEREHEKNKGNLLGAVVEEKNILSSLMRKTSMVKRNRAESSVTAAIPFSEKIEGVLEWRQVKGGQVKWKKAFGIVLEMKLYIFEKPEHRDNRSKALANYDITLGLLLFYYYCISFFLLFLPFFTLFPMCRSYIFIVRPAAIQHIRNVTQDELPLIFGIWEKDENSLKGKERHKDSLGSDSKLDMTGNSSMLSLVSEFSSSKTRTKQKKERNQEQEHYKERNQEVSNKI